YAHIYKQPWVFSKVLFKAMNKPTISLPPFGCFFLFFSLFFFFSLFSSVVLALTDAEASFIPQRQLLTLPENGELPDDIEYEVDLKVTFANHRLKRAYIALQAWKKAVYSDPFNTTGNWHGPHVCGYTGVFCASALDDPNVAVVAGVDLNGADIAGHLPAELGLMTDVAMFHLNSNRFCGIIPKSLEKLRLMHEFDVSNNRFVGPFPSVVLSWPAVKYIDVRYNDFEGQVPPELFKKDLDAIFLNNNRFTSTIPDSIGESSASVVTFAHNKFNGCIPKTIGNMKNLNEIIFKDNNLGGCFPSEIGKLANVNVFDASMNSFTGVLPPSFVGLTGVEEFDISGNKLTGFVPENICKLPKLVNLTYAFNYFNGQGDLCIPGSRTEIALDDTRNCLPDRPKQRSARECAIVISRPVDCSKDKCAGGSSHVAPSRSTSPVPTRPVHKPQTPKESPPVPTRPVHKPQPPKESPHVPTRPVHKPQPPKESPHVPTRPVHKPQPPKESLLPTTTSSKVTTTTTNTNTDSRSTTTK
ncbi:pollen-specific leucine-rich repeat extensin-like protein 3, partial [Capsella rubella]